MSGQSFRFIHASDLHLGQHVAGLPEAPEGLRDLLIGAPLTALKQIVELALHEEAAFVLLSGDVIDPQQCGPRPLAFLLEQFERLAAREISVYWATGRSDSAERWAAPLPLPNNVHLFKAGEIEAVAHDRYEQPLAMILGRGHDGRLWRANDFRPEASNRFTIALAYTEAPPDGLVQNGVIHYWALGGQHRRSAPTKSRPVVHFPGSPQSRGPDEPGDHGCTVVEVDASDGVKQRFVACDSVRWRRERLEIRDEAPRDELERALRRRVQAAAAEAPGKTVLAEWTIAGARRLSPALRTGGLMDEILEAMRSEFGSAATPVWIADLSIEPPDQFPESWLEEDTILGDFLRTVGQARSGVDLRRPSRDPAIINIAERPESQEPPRIVPPSFSEAALRTLLPMSEQHSEIVAAASLGDARERDELLRGAAAFGADLLRGEQ